MDSPSTFGSIHLGHNAPRYCARPATARTVTKLERGRPKWIWAFGEVMASTRSPVAQNPFAGTEPWCGLHQSRMPLGSRHRFHEAGCAGIHEGLFRILRKSRYAFCLSPSKKMTTRQPDTVDFLARSGDREGKIRKSAPASPLPPPKSLDRSQLRTLSS